MRKLAFVLIFVLLLFCVGCASTSEDLEPPDNADWSVEEGLTTSEPASDEEWFVVERVIDGDTFVLAGGERVRLIGVDTPETVAPNQEVEVYGQEASDFTKNLLEGKKVALKFDAQERDQYDRLLCYVFLEDGTFVNELLLKEGYATLLTVPPNIAYVDLFRKAQDEAVANNKGLWGLQETQEETETEYVDANGRGLIKGSRNKIYHLPGGWRIL